jgi:hypothetical protein
MKAWTQGQTLPTLKWETKLIYTLFLAFALLGIGVMGALATTHSGTSRTAIATYYAGDEAQGIYPKTAGELLEVTHYHLFAIPLLLFTLGHVFLLSSWPRGWKAAVVLAAFLGALALIAAPWLILYAGREWAVLVLIARKLLALPLLLFIAVPLWEMWGKRVAEE